MSCLEEAIGTNDIGEVRRGVAAALREANVGNSTIINTAIQSPLNKALVDRAAIVNVALDQEVLALTSIDGTVVCGAVRNSWRWTDAS